MKIIIYVLIYLSACSLTISQNYYSDFEDGTLQGWTNSDISTTLLIVNEEPPIFYLQKGCDGSNSAIGEMTIINTDQWSGNYWYDPSGNGETLRVVDQIYIKNENDFDIHLRYGFTGANGYMVVTSSPIIVPALSNWNSYDQYYHLNFPIIHNLSVINDTSGIPIEEVFGHVHELFEEVIEFRIFHSEDISFNGEIVTGTLQIDEVYSTELLSTNDQNLSEIQLFPNPVEEILNIFLPNDGGGDVTVYNLLGVNVFSKRLNASNEKLNLTHLKSGIYLVRIEIENQSTIKKIVKL